MRTNFVVLLQLIIIITIINAMHYNLSWREIDY